jgi:hypothetical protein
MASYSRTCECLSLLTAAVSDNLVKPSFENQPMKTRSINRVSLASGHITREADAEDFLGEVYEFLCMVERGEVEPRVWRYFRGEEEVLYERDDGKISFGGPRTKFLKFIHKLETDCCLVF